MKNIHPVDYIKQSSYKGIFNLILLDKSARHQKNKTVEQQQTTVKNSHDENQN